MLMKVAFISNFLNHHMISLCNEFLSRNDVEFFFIATEKIPESRLSLGYEDMNHKFEFCICNYDSKEKHLKCQKIVDEADLLIVGSFKNIKIKNKSKRIIMFYSERLFKEQTFSIKTPLRFFKYLFQHYKFKNGYLLCSSAFAANDFAITGNFINNVYKWGYFPEFINHDVNKLLIKKNNEKIKILWVGRYIAWKHPESMIYLCKYLLKKGISNFTITMIGNGKLFNNFFKKINANKLNNYIDLKGSLNYKKVREYMEESDIFAFTSDKNEGWGVV